MPQYRVYHVKDHRISFRCPECQTRRILVVPPDIRVKNVRCHQCGAVSKTILNRRLVPRQQQSGKATMILPGGRQVDIDLHDISPGGLGFSIDEGSAGLLSVTDEVTFSCAWNPDLFTETSYTIKNIHGTRVSVQGRTRVPQEVLL